MRFVLAAAVLLAGCGNPSPEGGRPLFGLVLPKGTEDWKREVVAGFRAMAERWQYDIVVKDYSHETPDAILAAVAAVPQLEGIPVCIVFTMRNHVKPVLDKLSEQHRLVITVGEDDAMATRDGHVGMSAERLAYLWKIRMSQLTPKRGRALFVFGSEPLKVERIRGAVYSRSNGEKDFRMRFKALGTVKDEDFSWADIVTPIGADAVSYCRSRAVGKLLPVSSSSETLDMVNSGDASMAITPEYFQMGFRALQLARDIYIMGTTGKPIVSVHYGEADRDSMRIYLDKRYKLPPGPRHAEDEEADNRSTETIAK